MQGQCARANSTRGQCARAKSTRGQCVRAMNVHVAHESLIQLAAIAREKIKMADILGTSCENKVYFSCMARTISTTSANNLT